MYQLEQPIYFYVLFALPAVIAVYSVGGTLEKKSAA